MRDCRKLQIPVFSGEDVQGWIYRVENYFEVHQFGKKDRLLAVTLCLEGAPLNWFKRRLLERFQASREGSALEQFLSIQQTSSVREYVDQCESFAGQLGYTSESVQESTFTKGLKEEVRSAVRIAEPASLAQAIRMAIRIDENKAGGSSKNGGSAAKPGYGYQGKVTTANPPSTAKKEGFKYLTPKELTEKRANGLCYKCDAKFAPGHKCSVKLQVLIVDEEIGEEDGAEGDDEGHAHLDMAEVSLNAISGLTPPQTMKVKGKLRGMEVIVLIDSGATHNFVSTRIMKRLGIKAKGRRAVRVKLGNGLLINSRGTCKGRAWPSHYQK